MARISKWFLFSVISIFCCIKLSYTDLNHNFHLKDKKLEDFQIKVLRHMQAIFLNIQAIFLNISIEENVPSQFSSQIIDELSTCSSYGIMVSR